MKIYCDGSGWNGQLSKFGVMLEDGKNSNMSFSYPLTNNQMEYAAIILAALIAHEDDTLLSDSQLAVNQINGVWKVKEPKLRPLRDAAVALIQGRGLKLEWIPREQNKADKII